MRSLRPEEVNNKHTYTWVKCNDDAKSKYWRNKYLKEFGGRFVNKGKEFIWEKNLVEVPKKEEKEKQAKIIVTKPDGTEDVVENFTKYCRDNQLTRSALYEVITGKRSQHKGYKARREHE